MRRQLVFALILAFTSCSIGLQVHSEGQLQPYYLSGNLNLKYYESRKHLIRVQAPKFNICLRGGEKSLDDTQSQPAKPQKGAWRKLNDYISKHYELIVRASAASIQAWGWLTGRLNTVTVLLAFVPGAYKHTLRVNLPPAPWHSK
mmetsp:Transcript_82544/g.221355  ORF Transcript_82544/g.221355 Transcript_82544/m.221355 type:complete len:145 (+) Transcript_82544:64-498(+)